MLYVFMTCIVKNLHFYLYP